MYSISKITPTKKFGFNNIYINEVYLFTVCDLVLAEYKLKEKLDINENTIEHILCSELTERFKSFSLNILSSRPRSEKEISNKLNERVKKYKESWPIFNSRIYESQDTCLRRQARNKQNLNFKSQNNTSPGHSDPEPVEEGESIILDPSVTPHDDKQSQNKNDGPKILNLKETILDSSDSLQSPQNDRTYDRHTERSEVSRNLIIFKDAAVNSIFATAKENTIEFLKKYNYLNNNDFAEWLILQRVNQGKGKLFIKQDMFKKGVSKEIIEATLKSTNFELSIKPVYDKAVKKYLSEKDPYKKRQKIYRYLLSRGFEFTEISETMKIDNL